MRNDVGEGGGSMEIFSVYSLCADSRALYLFFWPNRDQVRVRRKNLGENNWFFSENELDIVGDICQKLRFYCLFSKNIEIYTGDSIFDQCRHIFQDRSPTKISFFHPGFFSWHAGLEPYLTRKRGRVLWNAHTENKLKKSFIDPSSCSISNNHPRIQNCNIPCLGLANASNVTTTTLFAHFIINIRNRRTSCHRAPSWIEAATQTIISGTFPFTLN